MIDAVCPNSLLIQDLPQRVVSSGSYNRLYSSNPRDSTPIFPPIQNLPNYPHKEQTSQIFSSENGDRQATEHNLTGAAHQAECMLNRPALASLVSEPNVVDIKKYNSTNSKERCSYKELFKQYVGRYRRQHKKVIVTKTSQEQKQILNMLLMHNNCTILSDLLDSSPHFIVISAKLEEQCGRVLDLVILAKRKTSLKATSIEDFSFNLVSLADPAFQTTSNQYR